MRKPEIYISASYVDFSLVASLIQSEVLALGASPIYLDTPPREWHAALALLEHHISKCDAVIHVAGESFGSEPEGRPQSEMRRSFAQLEYAIARSLGKRVFVYICSDTFPYSSHPEESADLRGLQQIHRDKLARHNLRQREADTPDELREWIRDLKTSVEELASRQEEPTPQRPVVRGDPSINRPTSTAEKLTPQSTSRLPIPWNPPPAAEDFVGRALQRESMVQAVKKLKRVALVGAPGIGKSALIAACLHEIAPGPESPGPFSCGIFRHSFHIRTSHQAALATLVAQAGLESLPDTRHEAAVRQILSRPGVCLILEGCEKADSLSALLSLSHQAYVVLESRDSLSLPAFDHIEVHQLPVNDAAFLLHRVCSRYAPESQPIPVPDTPVWHKISTRLGAHPLLLLLAARRMQAESLSPDSYLHALELDNVNLFTAIETEPAGVPWAFANWAEEFSRLHPPTLSVWQSLSLHAWAPVPESSLAAILNVEASGLGEQLRLLLERDFLTAESVAGATQGSKEPAWKLAHIVLAEAGRLLWMQLDPMQQSRTFNPQAGYLRWRDWWLKYLHECWKSRSIPGGAKRYEVMVPHFEALLTGIERQEGATSPNILTAIRWISALHRLMGCFAKAQPLSERLVALTENLHGPEHPDTLAALNNLATLHYRKGDLAAADPLYRKILRLRERILGLDHPDTLSSQNNMANVLADRGDVAGAEALYRTSLEGRQRVLGPEEQDTLVSAKNLANLLLDKGDFDRAEPLFKNTLAVQFRVLGFQHPDTAMTAYNYARLCTQQKRLPEAAELARHAAEAARIFFPEGHPHRQRYEQLLARLAPYVIHKS